MRILNWASPVEDGLAAPLAARELGVVIVGDAGHAGDAGGGGAAVAHQPCAVLALLRITFQCILKFCSQGIIVTNYQLRLFAIVRNPGTSAVTCLMGAPTSPT